MTPDITNTTKALEALIDKHGLLHVLTGLEIICGEKSDHIRGNWQDFPLADIWLKASHKMGKIVREVAPLNI